MSLSVVILAAGKGTRMRSSLPKVLHPIADKPMVSHVIESARQLNADNIYVVYGFGGDVLKTKIQGDDLTFVEQVEQLGTGHAVDMASPFLKDDDNYATILKTEEKLKEEEFCVLAQEDIAANEHLIQTGDIIALATSINGLDVTHTGIAIREKDGRIHLLHASTSSMEVEITKVPLVDYLKKIKSNIGEDNRFHNVAHKLKTQKFKYKRKD